MIHPPRTMRLAAMVMALLLLLSCSVASATTQDPLEPILQDGGREVVDVAISNSPHLRREEDGVGKAIIAARILLAESEWGVLGTLNGSLPFTSVVSSSDGIHGNRKHSAAKGTPYFLLSAISERVRQLRKNPAASYTVSMAQQQVRKSILFPEMPKCGGKFLDPEDPRCPKLTLAGKLVVVKDRAEKRFALKSLLSRHPQMRLWIHNPSHDFEIYKMHINTIFFINHFGGAPKISPHAFLEARLTDDSVPGLSSDTVRDEAAENADLDDAVIEMLLRTFRDDED